jgi:hypothetical protein
MFLSRVSFRRQGEKGIFSFQGFIQETVYNKQMFFVLGHCFHQLIGQRFSREHFGSFLAGTRILEKRRVFL